MRAFRSTTAATTTPTTEADPAMATATRRRPALIPAPAAAPPFAGCGGAARAPAGHASAEPGAAFAWLRPAAAPSGWKVGRLPSRTAALAYPAAWRAITTDPGTFSAAL